MYIKGVKRTHAAAMNSGIESRMSGRQTLEVCLQTSFDTGIMIDLC